MIFMENKLVKKLVAVQKNRPHQPRGGKPEYGVPGNNPVTSAPNL